MHSKLVKVWRRLLIPRLLPVDAVRGTEKNMSNSHECYMELLERRSPSISSLCLLELEGIRPSVCDNRVPRVVKRVENAKPWQAKAEADNYCTKNQQLPK